MPAGLEECFLLPQVKSSMLTELGIELPSDLAADAFVSPAPTVLAMGFSWSFYFCQRMVEACVENCGISRHQFVRDRQCAPRIDEGEFVGSAVYVDGAAILGCDVDKVDSKIAAVKMALDQVGLQCPNLELSGKGQVFCGLEFDSETGRIRVPPARIWKLRLALLHVPEKGKITGSQLRRLVGHYMWAALLRRESLSILAATYRFIDLAGDMEWRLWGSVRRELRWAVTLPPFLQSNVKRPWCPLVTATDAEGAGGVDCGGWGVTKKRMDVKTVRELGSVSEKWRFDVEDAISARKQAFASEQDAMLEAIVMDTPRPTGARRVRKPPVRTCPVPAFVAVAPSAIGDFDSWQLACRGRWSRAEKIVRTEGRALTIGLRHAVRTWSYMGSRLVILCDNLGLVLGLAKGRGTSAAVNACCREVGALLLLTGCSLHVRWIASEQNPADKPSRARPESTAAGVCCPLSQASPRVDARETGGFFDRVKAEQNFYEALDQYIANGDPDIATNIQTDSDFEIVPDGEDAPELQRDQS